MRDILGRLVLVIAALGAACLFAADRVDENPASNEAIVALVLPRGMELCVDGRESGKRRRWKFGPIPDGQSVEHAFRIRLPEGQTTERSIKLCRGDIVRLVAITPENEDASWSLVVAQPPDAPLDKSVEGLLQEGQEFLQQDRARLALAAFGDTVRLAPGSALAYFYRGEAHRVLGQWDRAATDYGRAIAIDPDCAGAYNNRGIVRCRAGEHEKAIPDYSKAVEIVPEHRDAYYNRGLARYEIGEHDEALSDFTKAIEIGLTSADVYYVRGTVWREKGEYDKAIADYDAVIEVAPEDRDAYYDRGRARHAIGDYDEAITDFDKAIQIDQGFADAYNCRGSSRCMKGEHDDAIVDFTTAVDIDPKLSHAYNNRGNAWLEKAKYKEAFADFDKAIDVDPRNAIAYHNRGNARHATGDYDNAIADYDMAIRIDARFIDAYHGRALAWIGKGDYEKAIASCDELIVTEPKLASPRTLRGNVCHPLGRVGEAMESYTRAIEIDPKCLPAYEARSVCRAEQGESQAARLDEVVMRILQAGLLETGTRVSEDGGSPRKNDHLVLTRSVLATTADGEPIRLAVGTEITVTASAGNSLEGTFHQGGRTVSAEFNSKPFGAIRPPPEGCIGEVDASVFLALLKSFSRSRQCLQVHWMQSTTFEGCRVQIVEFERDPRSLAWNRKRTWRSTAILDEHWRVAATLLADNAPYLTDLFDGVAIVPGNGLCRFVELTYEKPRNESLQVGSPKSISLSPELQQYLMLTAASDYEASRSIVIIAEPHYDADQQWNLFKGLEILFAENAHLCSRGQCAMLAEAVPANTSLRVRELVEAEPEPSQQLIRDILGTYLIPGYVAYLWKHSPNAVVLGAENPDLYRICNRLHADLWEKAPNRYGTPPEEYAKLCHLTYRSVARRNQAMARTVLDKLRRYGNIFLFVGDGHVGPYPMPRVLLDSNWKLYRDLLDAQELDLLRKTPSRGIADFLREQDVGYYVLTPRKHPIRDPHLELLRQERYARLRFAQDRGEMSSHVEDLLLATSGCVVAPAPGAAAGLVSQSYGHGHIAPPLLGHGSSSPPWSASFPKQRLAERLVSLLDDRTYREFVTLWEMLLPKDGAGEAPGAGSEFRAVDFEAIRQWIMYCLETGDDDTIRRLLELLLQNDAISDFLDYLLQVTDFSLDSARSADVGTYIRAMDFVNLPKQPATGPGPRQPQLWRGIPLRRPAELTALIRSHMERVLEKPDIAVSVGKELARGKWRTDRRFVQALIKEGHHTVIGAMLDALTNRGEWYSAQKVNAILLETPEGKGLMAQIVWGWVLRHQYGEIAGLIARGRSWRDDKSGWGAIGLTAESELARHLERVLRNGADDRRILYDGRSAYWEERTRTLIIVDPRLAEIGTARRVPKTEAVDPLSTEDLRCVSQTMIYLGNAVEKMTSTISRLVMRFLRPP